MPAFDPKFNYFVAFEIGFRTEEEWKEFQKLIQQGSSLVPDMSPSMKEFADLVTSGAIQQDYYAQANLPRPT